MTSSETGWTTTPITDDLVRGALELERTPDGVLPHRLPASARRQIPDDQLAMAESQPSGVRLLFRTEATTVELVVHPLKMTYVGAPPRPDGVYDLVVDGRLVAQATADGGDVLTVDMASGTTTTQSGPPGVARFEDLPPGAKDVEVWLPHTEVTRLVAVRADALVEPACDSGRRVWLHHGSSISQGSNATSPSTTWPAVAALRGGIDLVNLGFGGSALLDPFVARAMRDTPSDLISIKVGINLVNTDLMRLRAFAPAVHGFLDTIREGHPTTPILVVSPILCPIHESTPGPTAMDFSGIAEGRLAFGATGDASDATRLTLTIIRDELSQIVAARTEDDPHLSYLDGRDLYGDADQAELPLPDQLHPDPATHLLIGERFGDLGFFANPAG